METPVPPAPPPGPVPAGVAGDLCPRALAARAGPPSIPQRFTFTFPLINAAARLMFLVAGSEKAKVLKAALTEPASGLPASMVHPANGRLTWLLDRPAAALLDVGKKR